MWRHRDAVRFWESNGGAGPRGTPTLNNGRVYAFGATGILNALDAGSGAVVWSRNAASDTGDGGPGLGLLELAAGDRRHRRSSPPPASWPPTTPPLASRAGCGPTGGGGYSSPHLMTIDGVPQILLLRGRRRDQRRAGRRHRALGAHVGAGRRHRAAGSWPTGRHPDHHRRRHGRASACAASRSRTSPSGWTVEERWTSRGLKPYFNDFVVHKGHASASTAAFSRASTSRTATRKWKGGRYGSGQLVLLARPGPAAGAVGGRRAGARSARRPTSSRSSRGSRRSRARPGTTRCWSATSCWFATARRWPRSGCPAWAADEQACWRRHNCARSVPRAARLIPAARGNWATR